MFPRPGVFLESRFTSRLSHVVGHSNGSGDGSRTFSRSLSALDSIFLSHCLSLPKVQGFNLNQAAARQTAISSGYQSCFPRA